MLTLPTLALYCVATRDHVAAGKGWAKAQQGIEYGQKILLTDKPEHFDTTNTTVIVIPPFVHYEDVCVWYCTQSPDILLSAMTAHVQAVICCAWDGFPINNDCWTDEFLEQDYIGAVMHGWAVGNGGFTYMSRRWFEALKRLNLPATREACFPSDQILCIRHRAWFESQGIKFAPVALAERFSKENRPPYDQEPRSWGGHGKLFISDLCKQGRY